MTDATMTAPLAPAAARDDQVSRAPELGAALLLAALLGGALLLTESWPPRAAGTTGIVLGALGLALMLGGTLGYAWRKRHAGPGSLQHWLQAHIVTGVLGPLLILLHSGFAFRGLAGATFVLMLVLVGSGITGRYLYPASPRRRRVLSVWWLLHAPLAYALFLLALVHAAAALYLTWAR